MLKATIRSLLTHKLRLAMTALAIVLGVAFVSGTYVLTDTLGNTFDNLFQDITAGSDVTVRGQTAFDDEQTPRPPMPESVLAEITEVDGVAYAEGAVTGFAQFLDREGEVISTQAPTLGVNWGNNDELSPLNMREGEPPVGPAEVAMDAGTAEDNGFQVGDSVRVLTIHGTDDFTLTGIFTFGELNSLAGATLAAFETPVAQELMDRQGEFDEIAVVAEEGVTDRELSKAVADAIGDEYDVVTSGQAGQEQADQIKEGLSFFNTALLSFAFIALFVGSFLIANTFSIIVAQRTREIALLRAIGATRRQIMTSIVGEALVTGLVASLVGVGAGILVAIGLQKVLAAFGVDIPTTGLVVSSRAVVVPIVVGLIITIVSAIGPARRATNVPPVAALRDDFQLPADISRRRIVAGTALLIASAALLMFGLFGGGIQLVGIGAFGTFMGVSAVAPVLAKPLAHAIGSPIARWMRVPGKLARDNSKRNPRRTASTAAALMIGVALVSLVTIFASSINASTVSLIEESTDFDLILQTTNFQSVSPEVSERIAELDEVSTAAGLTGGQFQFDNETKSLLGADLAEASKVLRFDMLEGTVSAAFEHGLLVSEPEAEVQGFEVGETIAITFAKTGEQQLTVEGIYERNPLAGNYVLAMDDYEANFEERLDFLIAVKKAPDVSLGEAQSAVSEEVGTDFPNLDVLTKAEYLEDQKAQIDQILGLMTALLALALIIAFIGIVNTLALSIYERIREIGMLRAIGMSRRQLRRMVRWEAVIVAVLGAILGMAIGAFFGWALVTSLSDEGLSEFRLPLGTLLSFLVVAAFAGIAAAVLPARRAARLDVLRAIATE
jgi:putative ABC transport system permease protein